MRRVSRKTDRLPQQSHPYTPTPDGFERRRRRVTGVAVVDRATAVQAAVTNHRRPRPEALGPAADRGLLVEVPVHQDGPAIRRARGGRDVDEQQRGAALELDDLEDSAGQVAAGDPASDVLDRGGEVAVRGPLGVEGR